MIQLTHGKFSIHERKYYYYCYFSHLCYLEDRVGANVACQHVTREGSCKPNKIRLKKKGKWGVGGEGEQIQGADLATIYHNVQHGHDTLSGKII